MDPDPSSYRPFFFQQSNVVDKRITPRWVKNEQSDTIIGAFLTNIEAAGLIIAAAFVFRWHQIRQDLCGCAQQRQRVRTTGPSNNGCDPGDCPAQRERDWCLCCFTCHVLCLWRRVQGSALAASQSQRGKGILRFLRRTDHPGWSDCTDSECTAWPADVCSASSGGNFAAKRHRLPGAAVQ